MKAVAAAVVLLSLFQLLTTERIERPGHDSSIYILGARSLATRGDYRMDGVPITTHPPGLSLLLSPVFRVFGEKEGEFLVRLMPVFGGLGLLVWLLLLSRAATPSLAAAAVLIVATSAVYHALATRHVMADLPYLVFSGLALLAGQRLSWAATRPGMWALGAAVVLLTGFAVLTRTAGVALAVTFLAGSFLPSRAVEVPLPRHARLWLAAAGLCGVLVLAAWVAWCRQAEGREEMGGHMASYTSQFRLKNPLQPDLGPASAADLIRRAAAAAPLRSAQTAEILTRLPWVSPRWYNPLVLALFVLPLAALPQALRQPQLMLVWLYCAAYFAMLCLWPFAETARFMLPAAPAVFVLAAIGAGELASRWRGIRPGRAALVLLAVGALAGWSALRSPEPPGMQEKLSLLFWPAAAAACAAMARLLRQQTLVARAAPLGTRAIPAAVAALAIIGLGAQLRLSAENLSPQPERQVNGYLHEVAAWLRHQPPGAVMASTFPYVHRMTGRRCVTFPVTGDPRRIREAIERHRIRYLIVAEKTGEQAYFRPSEPERAAALAAAYPGLLRKIRAGQGWTAYEVALSGVDGVRK